MRTILVSIGLLALPFSAVAAQPDTIVIRATPADLSSETGLASLWSRINDAAKTVCKQRDDGTFRVPDGERLCVKAAVADAVKSSKVTSLKDYAASFAKPPKLQADNATLAAR